MSKLKPAFALITVFLVLSGCTGFRAYYNAYFNAKGAFQKAESLKQKRLKEDPLDSLKVASDEKIQLERAIEKASKVLELYGHKPNKYLSKSLFMIGEAYLKLGEYDKAAKKYDELEKAYPKYEKIEIARFHRAVCRFNGDNYPVAKRALLKFIAETKNQTFKLEAMQLFAELEQKNNSDTRGLAAYQELLREKGLTSKAKGFIYFECATLAFALEQYEQARENALAPEVKLLTLDLRFRAKFIASQSLDFLGDRNAAIAEMEYLLKKEEFSKFQPEVHLALGIWYLEANRKKDAFKLFKRIAKALPKSALAAEAFFRMGEYTLNFNKDEKNAIDYYTSSSECGDTLEYARKAEERAASLKKLQTLRRQTDSPDSLGLAKNFYMAELFLFNLDNFDSAVSHINKIVNDTAADSASAIKASYARAFIYDEFKDSTDSADSLYQYVIQRFPNTDYAKQAEINMGKVPETITGEDRAHELFLKAEILYFGGYDYNKTVIPAYKTVIDNFPETRYAAKAQFVIAMLHEFQYERGDNSALFLAKKAHAKLRKSYTGTKYFEISNAKLLEAGIREGDEIKDTPALESASGVEDAKSEHGENEDFDKSQYEEDDEYYFEEVEDSPEVLENDGE